MTLCSTKEMLQKAKIEQYAIGAFNFENMEMAQAIILAAEEMQSPIILQTTPKTLKYADAEVYSAMVKKLVEKASVPIALNLDHGEDLNTVNRCLKAGYTAVMIDGSKESFMKNIELTKQVKILAKQIPVEAELGTIGGKGI